MTLMPISKDNVTFFQDDDETIDPMLLWAKMNGTASQSALEQSDNEMVHVAAKINDLRAWKTLEGIQFGSETFCSEGRWIVTAQLQRKRVLEIKRLPYVEHIEFNRHLSLESATSFTASDSASHSKSKEVDHSDVHAYSQSDMKALNHLPLKAEKFDD